MLLWRMAASRVTPTAAAILGRPIGHPATWHLEERTLSGPPLCMPLAGSKFQHNVFPPEKARDYFHFPNHFYSRVHISLNC